MIIYIFDTKTVFRHFKRFERTDIGNKRVAFGWMLYDLATFPRPYWDRVSIEGSRDAMKDIFKQECSVSPAAGLLRIEN